jgi:hypothetical protein
MQGWSEAMQLMVEGDKWEMWAAIFQMTLQMPPERQQIMIHDYDARLGISCARRHAVQVHSLRAWLRRQQQTAAHQGQRYARVSDGDY